MKTEQDEQWLDYRRHLVNAEQAAQSDWDRTVLTLAGGALGVSFAFVNTFLADGQIIRAWALFSSWALWALTMAFVLVSFFLSRQTLRTVINEVDSVQQGEQDEISPRLGGCWRKLTEVANALAAILLLAGVVMIIFFVYSNWPGSK